MEVRLLVFLFFVCGGVIANTLVIWGIYKAFAGMSTKVTTAVDEFQKSSETREWIESMRVAAEQAVTVTQATKERMTQLEPVLSRAQENYDKALALADVRLKNFADQVNSNADKVRDTVAKPAFSVMAFAAGITRVLESLERGE